MPLLSLGLMVTLGALSAGDICTPKVASLEVVQASATQSIDLAPFFARAKTLKSAGKDGVPHDYAAIPLADVLDAAKLPMGKALRGKAVGLVVVAEAKDAYQVSFALAEVDDGIGARAVWIAGCRDGRALADDEGPLRLLVPDDKRPARAVRQLSRLRVIAP